jgi:Flp pilus assembly pilin Flp
MGRVIAQSLPGTNILENLGAGLQAWGVVVGIIAVVVSALLWALGAGSDNAQQASRGKRGVLFSLIAVALIGAAPVLVGWAFALGKSANGGG